MQEPAGLPKDINVLFCRRNACLTARKSVFFRLEQVLEPAGLPKDINVSFYGTYHLFRGRVEMRDQLADQHYDFGKASNAETALVIERSNFTLAPRGFGATSFRMYEALQLGSVPIYIWDYDLALPFQVRFCFGRQVTLIGATSFRMYETLQLGSVPLYIWDYDLALPFQVLLPKFKTLHLLVPHMRRTSPAELGSHLPLGLRPGAASSVGMLGSRAL